MAPDQVFLYHITHVANLPQIIERGGLLAYNRIHADGVKYTNIAYSDLQEKRARTIVPCGAGGTLHDYVPFYFGSRSPMLYTIDKGNVPGYDGGQRSVIHLVVSVADIVKAGCSFVFTDGHAIKAYTTFYDDLAALDKIDWELMRVKYWNETIGDLDRPRRRQAEFLVHESLPWAFVRGIGVINEAMKEEVLDLLSQHQASCAVVVRPSWYYLG